jgi:nucleoside-diphosphate-sugar epimerase
VLEGDIRNPAAVAKAVTSVEVVHHLAALPSVARSMADPVASHQVNVDGTLNVLLAAPEAGVRRLVYVSSSSVSGDTPVLPKHEGMPVSPRSPYAAAKLAGEVYCRSFARVYPLDTVCLRFFNVFGPRQDPGSQGAAVVPRFATRILAGWPAEVAGDGRQTRAFTFVANAIHACRAAAGAGPDAVGETMNVGCGDRISVLDLVGPINDLLAAPVDPVFTPAGPGDVHDSQASIAEAERLIGYRRPGLLQRPGGADRPAQPGGRAYRKAPAEVAGIDFPTVAEGDRSTHKDFTILVDAERFGMGAPELAEALVAEGIQTRRYYSPPSTASAPTAWSAPATASCRSPTRPRPGADPAPVARHGRRAGRPGRGGHRPPGRSAGPWLRAATSRCWPASVTPAASPSAERLQHPRCTERAAATATPSRRAKEMIRGPSTPTGGAGTARTTPG